MARYTLQLAPLTLTLYTIQKKTIQSTFLKNYRVRAVPVRCPGVISVYASQVGRTWEKKESFVEELEHMIRKIPGNETLIIGGDLNAHLGEWNKDYREKHGQHGYGNSNEEEELWFEMMEANKPCAINTCFKKRGEHLITYKSGNSATQSDYILIRQEDRSKVKNAKVLPYEAVTKQHILLVGDMSVNIERTRRKVKKASTTKVWKLKTQAEEYNRYIKERRLMETWKGQTGDEMWEKMCEVLYESADCYKGKEESGQSIEGWLQESRGV